MPRTAAHCRFLLKTICLKSVTAFGQISLKMSSKSVPTTSEHQEQMAIARLMQANRTPINPPRQQNRGQGGLAGRAGRGHHRATSSFGRHATASHRNQPTRRRGPSSSTATSGNHGTFSAVRTTGGGGGLNSSMWASSTSHDYVLPHMRGPGK